ncbi:MAG: hypothetical protein ABR928_11410 [Terracidiphilus sp.]
MTLPLGTPLMRRILSSAAAMVLAATFASAQSQVSSTPSSGLAYSASSDASSNDSSSTAFNNETVSSLFKADEAEPVAGGGGGNAGANGQEYGGGGGWKHYVSSRWAFEAGGGANAPAGDKSYITWGGQFTVGGGLNFNKHLAALIEYQFMDDKLPGALIAETGADGGHAHIWSFTIAPVIDLMPKATNDVYVTGGGGFYRKVTSFTDPEEEEYCTYYYCGTETENAVVGHFSSNQGGFNIGAGFQHRVGGLYGDGKTKLFIEARYVELFSPASISNPNGLGTTAVAADTKVVPISLGVRF